MNKFFKKFPPSKLSSIKTWFNPQKNSGSNLRLMHCNLLLHLPITPINSQCRQFPLHLIVLSGGRKQRRRITIFSKASRFAISFSSSFRRLLSPEKTSLDLVVLALASAVAGGRLVERDLGIRVRVRVRVLVSVILGLGIDCWKMWVGLVVLGILLWRRRGKKGFSIMKILYGYDVRDRLSVIRGLIVSALSLCFLF